VSEWYATTSEASAFGADGSRGVMNEPRNDASWKVGSCFLELRSGFMASIRMRRPVAVGQLDIGTRTRLRILISEISGSSEHSRCGGPVVLAGW
jgi:hypothetical protein